MEERQKQTSIFQQEITLLTKFINSINLNPNDPKFTFLQTLKTELQDIHILLLNYETPDFTTTLQDKLDNLKKNIEAYENKSKEIGHGIFSGNKPHIQEYDTFMQLKTQIEQRLKNMEDEKSTSSKPNNS